MGGEPGFLAALREFGGFPPNFRRNLPVSGEFSPLRGARPAGGAWPGAVCSRSFARRTAARQASGPRRAVHGPRAAGALRNHQPPPNVSGWPGTRSPQLPQLEFNLKNKKKRGWNSTRTSTATSTSAGARCRRERRSREAAVARRSGGREAAGPRFSGGLHPAPRGCAGVGGPTAQPELAAPARRGRGAPSPEVLLPARRSTTSVPGLRGESATGGAPGAAPKGARSPFEGYGVIHPTFRPQTLP